MDYIRIPRRFLFDEEEVVVPRPRRRRRTLPRDPESLETLLQDMKKEVEAVERYQEEQKKKYSASPTVKGLNKISTPQLVALTFAAAPFIWVLYGIVLYKLAQVAILGP